MTPDAGAQPGGLSPADGSGPRELLAYRLAQGRWVVAAMILGSSVAGIDSTVVAVALPAIGRNLHAGFQGLQWTVTSYTLTLASLILLAGSLSAGPDPVWPPRDRMAPCALTRVTISASLTGTRQPVLHRVGPAPDRSARRPPRQRRTIKALGAALPVSADEAP